MVGVNGNGHRRPTTPVAIIGLGCVLPDARSVEAFWSNILSGRSSIREVPHDRWDPALFHGDAKDPDRTYSKIGSFVEGYTVDPRRIRLPPKVIQATDPGQLWALDAAQQALADAGYDQRPFDRRRCGVILGATSSEEVRVPSSLRVYGPVIRALVERTPTVAALDEGSRVRLLGELDASYRAAFPVITEDTMPGELANITTGRLANLLNLTGKNYTTDAACASSAAALDEAMKSLESHECDMVLTGGVDHNQGVSTYVKFCRIGALSATGSRPFDGRADGFVMGEGAVVLLLKRLDDALADGDTIHAVVRGVGSSSDGRGRSIVAPSVDGQVECLRLAYEASGVDPARVGLVECHGTSTLVGDAAEYEALRRTFSPTHAPGSLPIGSVKSNLGHLKAAAGAVGILKAVLALKHRTLPPSIGYEVPNPHMRVSESPGRVNTHGRAWETPGDQALRVAGVSSFGFGGTNFHVVLEEAPAAETVLWPLLIA